MSENGKPLLSQHQRANQPRLCPAPRAMPSASKKQASCSLPGPFQPASQGKRESWASAGDCSQISSSHHGACRGDFWLSSSAGLSAKLPTDLSRWKAAISALCRWKSTK